MKLKQRARLCIRNILKVREHETISDAIDRKKYHFWKKINRKTFSDYELRNALLSLGLKSGDTVIVHSSWRAFIGYEKNADSVIDLLLDIVGKKGTILMPAYTVDKKKFKWSDVSEAGYLSEIFRKKYCKARSMNSVFSMCAYGDKAANLTKDHIDSLYAFDEKSPYYLAMKNNAKILLMGLGKRPHKITLFHCVTYNLRNRVKCYMDVYTSNQEVLIVDENNKKIYRKIIDRRPGIQNNKRKFKKLFNLLVPTENYRNINRLDIFLFDAGKLYDEASKYIIDHEYNLYKKK